MAGIRFVIVLTSILIGAVILAPVAPVFGQDRMVLGPRQFEWDKAGGAVLCNWMGYLLIQAQTGMCGWMKGPSDEAIDDGVTAMDEFILANSSLHPTRAMLEEFKYRLTEEQMKPLLRDGLQKACERPFLGEYRKVDPEKIRASIKKLLAVPREPVMNPCL